MTIPPEAADLRRLLRSLDVFAGELPVFDVDAAPETPVELFVAWLHTAIRQGIREPHAMTLSTVDADGNPSARVLLLKNVTAEGWQFAVHADSPKGQDLAGRPAAALTFYWPVQARQIRLRGPVVADNGALASEDFLARSAGSRANALLGQQSRPLRNAADLDLATKRSMERVRDNPDLVAPEWTVYTLAPDTVEFWQGDKARRHTRLVYGREGERWTKQLLWP